MLSDKLREVLGKERIDKAKQYQPIEPKYRETHKPYQLPIEPELFLSGFSKIYQQLFERPYEFTDVAKDLILSFNTCEPKNAIVIGGTGTGKTSTMVALSYMMPYTNSRKFDVYYINRIKNDFAKHGEEVLDFHSRYYACLDDIGAEGTGIHYGAKVNISAELIEQRYARRLQTHYTTNLTPDELREYLGDRAYSRMKQNCQLFLLTGDDKRK